MKRIAIKNPVLEKRLFQDRLHAAMALIALAILSLIVRLIYLQVHEHHLYTTLSDNNQFQLEAIPPKRGLILDRNGVVLADSQPVFTLEVTPEKVIHFKSMIKKLKSIIALSQEDILRYKKQCKRHHSFQKIPLKLSLNESELAKFYANQWRFSGLQIHAHLIRHYPYQGLFTAALGYVGRISEQDYDALNDSNYIGTEVIGRSGLEKHYESHLHGTVGHQQLETDASGRIVRKLKGHSPQAGQTLHTSLDLNVQQAARSALRKERGAVVAIDPQSGEIIALYSNPSFDPNLLTRGISHAAFHQLRTDPSRPLFNRALRGQFPPGSVIKPLILFAGLNTGKLDPSEHIWDTGSFSLPGSSIVYRDWRHTGHGYVNLRKALIVSCDTYFYRLGELLGIEPIDTMAENFGFGEEPNIDLDEAVPGVVPSPNWKLAYKGQSWYPGDTINSSIGQGNWLVTPLQLALFIATIANHGQRMRPHLVTALENRAGHKTIIPVTEEAPVNLNNPKHWDNVISGMQGVITSVDPQGTGYRFGRHPPYTVAGKTGTVQLYDLRRQEDGVQVDKSLHDHSVFIAFAPINQPKIAIAVVVENTPIAPAVARKVIDAYLIGGAYESA